MKKLFKEIFGKKKKEKKHNIKAISIKVAIIGESSVGKTNIISRYVDDTFSSTSEKFASSNITKEITLTNGHCYQLDIRDTKGSESFRLINKIHYKDAQIVIMIYDITKAETFIELKEYWAPEIINTLKEKDFGN